MTLRNSRAGRNLPAEVRRMQILQSASRLFARKGYEVTTMDQFVADVL